MPEATSSTGEGANTSPTPTLEPDDVYYRFGGATISSMLHKINVTVTFICACSTKESLLWSKAPY